MELAPTISMAEGTKNLGTFPAHENELSCFAAVDVSSLLNLFFQFSGFECVDVYFVCIEKEANKCERRQCEANAFIHWRCSPGIRLTRLTRADSHIIGVGIVTMASDMGVS